jgi:hypothetical protein
MGKAFRLRDVPFFFLQNEANNAHHERLQYSEFIAESNIDEVEREELSEQKGACLVLSFVHFV